MLASFELFEPLSELLPLLFSLTFFYFGAICSFLGELELFELVPDPEFFLLYYCIYPLFIPKPWLLVDKLLFGDIL